MEEFPASKVHLQPDLLEVFQQTYVQTLMASLGVAIVAKFRSSVVGRGVFGRKIGVTYRRNSPFQWWGRGGGGKVYDK